MSETELPEELRQYFGELDEHIVRRIRDGKVGDSCFAAVMFICAAIDSLGCLVAPCGIRHNVHQRFTFVLREYFPGAYLAREREVWKLRNSLMHNALNVATFLSATARAGYQHLQPVGSTGFLFFDTGRFHQDLCAGVEGVKLTLLREAELAREARLRLEFSDFPAWQGSPDEAPPTPPPLYWFRQI
jgi:hypothetical protein